MAHLTHLTRKRLREAVTRGWLESYRDDPRGLSLLLPTHRVSCTQKEFNTWYRHQLKENA
ncbi:hypothetical protein ACN20G_20285 [Streptomyces sp. BI20]|uniref:hypothetical protein n=1 Tax=Streptomyces sp. BI20 TaxID=3403460 RepID=UPI003C77E353